MTKIGYARTSTVEQNIENFAKLINSQQLIFVKHSPVHDAKYKFCLKNVALHIEQFGGKPKCGWRFRHHEPKDMPQQYYLTAEHHCIWLNNDILLDITPLPQDKALYPLMNQGNHIFLPDNNADPIWNKVTLAPLPTQYYAIGDNQFLKEHVNALQEKEWETYQKELVEKLSAVGTPLQVKELIKEITTNKYFTTLWSNISPNYKNGTNPA